MVYELLAVLDKPGEEVSHVKFSANGDWLATISRSDDTVRIWDTKTLVISNPH